jgi:hypothetical protein
VRRLANLSFVFTGAVAGVPQVIATAGAGGVLAGEPGALEATPGFTRTGAA